MELGDWKQVNIRAVRLEHLTLYFFQQQPVVWKYKASPKAKT